jgi:hypothetical protein
LTAVSFGRESSWITLSLDAETCALKVTNRFGVERSLALEKPLFTIGRKAENDLQLLSDTVSRASTPKSSTKTTPTFL